MTPRNPLNDRDVDGNTMAWLAEKDYDNPFYYDDDETEEEEY